MLNNLKNGKYVVSVSFGQKRNTIGDRKKPKSDPESVENSEVSVVVTQFLYNSRKISL